MQTVKTSRCTVFMLMDYVSAIAICNIITINKYLHSHSFSPLKATRTVLVSSGLYRHFRKYSRARNTLGTMDYTKVMTPPSMRNTRKQGT